VGFCSLDGRMQFMSTIFGDLRLSNLKVDDNREWLQSFICIRSEWEVICLLCIAFVYI